MKSKIFLTLSIILLFCTTFAIVSNPLPAPANDGYVPKEGFVPNKETAIKIAEAIWLPIYGKMIYDEKPFKAKLIDGKVWQVEGSLKKDKNGEPRVGGTAFAEIQKSDGKILKVMHGK